jgi:glyoxylase-like metal-dependent hydrolase (beta-lactamase superfamily II)
MRVVNTAAIAALLMALSACNPAAGTGDTAATETAALVASPDVHAFRIGTMDAFALRDGGLSVPNDNKTLAIGESAADTNALLTAAGLPTDTLSLSIQPLLVRNGDAVMLFDTGAGGGMGTEGKLMASLTAAGVQPGQVTDIFISHLHGDHIGGLVTSAGALAFPNAAIRMSNEEWAAMKADATLAAVVTAITPRVQAFVAGAEIVPGVASVDIDGHTPGHSGYRIGTGADSLTYFADTMHHPVISVQRPDWTIQFDGDEATAEASRKALLARAASENLHLYGFHFPFPGLGRIRKDGETFVWAPDAPTT